MIPRRATGALLAALIASTAAGSAAAPVDPSRAQSDVDASMREGGYLFCKQPRVPLSREALALCAHASSIPGCEGFAAACTRREPRRWDFEPPAWLMGIVSKLVGGAAWLVAWVLLPGLCVALLVPVIRALLRSRRQGAEPSTPDAIHPVPVLPDAEPTTDEDALLARADDHHRRLAFDVALELYLAASLVSLDRRGALHLARDRTNGEYVRACAEASAQSGLRTIASEVDRVKFGGEPATAEGTARAGTAARAIVRGLAAAVGVLALLACTGCGGDHFPGQRRAGDDPAGTELLVDLLHRQGFGAGPLDGALASLPLPEPGVTGAAVVVDLERTEVDDETMAHLLEWAGAGGSLVLAGLPEAWPKELGLKRLPSWTPGDLASGAVEARRLLSRGAPVTASRDDESEDDDSGDDATVASAGPIYATPTAHGQLTGQDGLLAGTDAEKIAWLDGGATYAVAIPHGAGWITAVATGELLTNAALARPGNAAVALAIVSNADRQSVKIAQPEDGVSPPGSPLAAIERAGLGLGLGHAIAAALLLFLAAGVRMARPDPEPPPARRAFVEHVEAVGELYRRGGHAAHALAAYARLVDQRLRSRVLRGATDVPSLLAARAGLPLESCQRLWARASVADPAARGELGTLKELARVYSLAFDRER